MRPLPGRLHKAGSPPDLKRLLVADGIIDDNATLTPLSGGVSSEICLVNSGSRQFVVKRALPQLKVAEEWFADVGRNRNEAAYLRYVGAFRPRNVPQLMSVNSERGYFCMEYLGKEWTNWKQQMLRSECDLRVAGAAGDFLGCVHARSSHDPAVADQFNTLDIFEQLRIEPYLLSAARRHPSLKVVIEDEAARLRSVKEVLVHGDFSPKNILVKPDRLMVVDCEVAWYGDAAFDVAFLLNHLLLKSLLRPLDGKMWRAMFDAAWSSYVTSRFTPNEDVAKSTLEKNTGWLLLMLLLARIDGKSPVEYLTDAQRSHVRAFATQRLSSTRLGLVEVADAWFCELRKLSQEERRS